MDEDWKADSDKSVRLTEALAPKGRYYYPIGPGEKIYYNNNSKAARKWP